MDFTGGVISEEIIESVVENVRVKDDVFEWKLNYFSGIINVGVEGRQSNPVVNLYGENCQMPHLLNNNTGCYQRQ